MIQAQTKPSADRPIQEQFVIWRPEGRRYQTLTVGLGSAGTFWFRETTSLPSAVALKKTQIRTNRALVDLHHRLQKGLKVQGRKVLGQVKWETRAFIPWQPGTKLLIPPVPMDTIQRGQTSDLTEVKGSNPFPTGLIPKEDQQLVSISHCSGPMSPCTLSWKRHSGTVRSHNVAPSLLNYKIIRGLVENFNFYTNLHPKIMRKPLTLGPKTHLDIN